MKKIFFIFALCNYIGNYKYKEIIVKVMDHKNTITISIEHLDMEKLNIGYSSPKRIRRTVEVNGKEVYAETMTMRAYCNDYGSPAITAFEKWCNQTERLRPIWEAKIEHLESLLKENQEYPERRGWRGFRRRPRQK